MYTFFRRQPNVVDNKAELLVHNIRLLGLGEPVEREAPAGERVRAGT